MNYGGYIFAAMALGIGLYILAAGFRIVDLWKRYSQEQKDELYAQHGNTLKGAGAVLTVVGVVMLIMKLLA